MVMAKINRYSETDLKEFKDLIDIQLNKAIQEHNRMQERLDDIIDQVDDDSDMIDGSNRGSDREMLSMMLARSRKHIQDLENALLRIRNKSYGICVVTGELIDKRRLLAVLTTTKSLLGKHAQSTGSTKRVARTISGATPKIISKVISKPTSKPILAKNMEDSDDFLEDDELDLLDDELDNDIDDDTNIDLDNIENFEEDDDED